MSQSHLLPVRPAILLVEDDTAIRLLVRFWLQAHYDLTLAARFAEGLAAAAQTTFDLFLLDINLDRGQSGVALMRQLRHTPQHAKVPYIAFSASARPHERDRFIDQGFDDFVSKPCSKQDLLGALDRILGPPRPTRSPTPHNADP